MVVDSIIISVGMLWYGNLFGEKWMSLVGLTMESIEANPPGAMVWIVNSITSIASVYLLAWICVKANANSLIKGAAIGFAVSAVFILLTIWNGNNFAMKPMELSFINGGFSVVVLTISGIILGAWRKTA